VKWFGVPTAALARRVLSAVIFIPTFLWLLYGAPAEFISLFVLLLSAGAQREFTRMFERDGQGVYPRLGLLAGLGVTASFLRAGGIPLVFTAVVIVVLSAPLVGRRPPAWGPSAHAARRLLRQLAARLRDLAPRPAGRRRVDRLPARRDVAR